MHSGVNRLNRVSLFGYARYALERVLSVLNRVEPRATVSVIGDGGLFVYPQKDIEKMRKRGYE